MKKIILIFAFTIGFHSLYAQDIPQSGDNLTDNNLDKYQGTWLWTKETDTLKIFFKKENVLAIPEMNVRRDRLIGFHLYKKGKTIVESSMDFVNTNYTDNKYTIYVSSQYRNNYEKRKYLDGLFDDISKKKGGRVYLIANANDDELTWRIENHEGGIRVLTKDTKPEDPSMTLPNNIVLVKQLSKKQQELKEYREKQIEANEGKSTPTKSVPAGKIPAMREKKESSRLD